MKKRLISFERKHYKFLSNKTFKIMKLSGFLLLFTVMQVLAVDSYSQRTKILDLENVTVENVVKTEIAQQTVVTGKVTDEDGNTLPGVNIIIKGTITGTVTDMDGNYSIEVEDANVTLVFSFVGMVSQEILVGSQTTINVVLARETIGIEEVVAIGYGQMKKADLTGSVASLNDERLIDKPAFNLAQAISGKVPGVKIIEMTGAPGGNPMIRIRGTNSISSNNTPLFVVDGIEGVQNVLTIMNPNQIESIDVLKDASATAIYGARGSNGVIIITTKRGIEGRTQVEYNGAVTRSALQKNYKVNNTEQFLYVVRQSWLNINKYATIPNWPLCVEADLLPPGEGLLTYSDMPFLFEQTTAGGYTVPLMGSDGNYYKPRFDTNWESEIFKPTTSTNHQLSIRGGNERAKFGTFLGYTLDDGLLINSYFNRFSGRLTGDFKVNKWLDISSVVSINKTKERMNDISYFSGGISRGASETFPLIPPKYPDDPAIYGDKAGTYGLNVDYPVGEVDCQSPFRVSENVESFNDRHQFTGGVTFNFKITSDLSFKTNFAVDGNIQKHKNYGARSISRGSQGSARIAQYNNFYWQNENYFNYNKVFGDHSITGLLGSSWSRYTNEYTDIRNDHFFDDYYKYHSIQIGTNPRPYSGSSDGQSSLNSYFARANYGYKGKYLMTLTGRIDGSSKFGVNTKYGFFPSGSVAWRISEEEFAKSIAALSNAKLRLSVGQTGNQEIGSYVTQTFIGSGNVAMGDAVQTGLYPNSVGNPDLRWETTTQYDAGMDIGLFRDRIRMVFDYYYKLTDDMLLSVPLPRSTTTGSVRQNYGTVENKGFEILISTHNVKNQDLNWYTDIAWSTNKNEIIKLGPTGADIRTNYWVGGPNTILREGEPIGSFLGLNRLGTYGTDEASLAAQFGFVPGDVKYEDKNGDGMISYLSDGSVLGNAFPKWDMDITNTLDYKNFDFNLDIRFSYGASKENRTNHSGEDRQVMDNSKVRSLDAWRPDHQDTMIGQVRPGMGGAYYQTYPDTHWIEDASFVRGEGMTIGYTLSESVLNRIGVGKLRIYATAKNFFVLTEYTGYDPEGASSGQMNDSLTPGMDFYMYPRPTTYTFGVNVIF